MVAVWFWLCEDGDRNLGNRQLCSSFTCLLYLSDRLGTICPSIPSIIYFVQREPKLKPWFVLFVGFSFYSDVGEAFSSSLFLSTFPLPILKICRHCSQNNSIPFVS